MQKLNEEYLRQNGWPEKTRLPEKVLQFGEGNFLRGFVDWMINKLNKEGKFGGSVVVIQPIEKGLIDTLNGQDGLYTLIMRGIENGELKSQQEIINAISRGINPYTDYDAYIQCAHNPDLRVIISNTTEAGIAYVDGETLDAKPQKSFPGKITAFLYERYRYFDGDNTKGFIIIPCELIDKNADRLKEIVLQYANEWQCGEGFVEWVLKANVFANSLVDRIVTGYPRDEIEALTSELGYKDDLVDTCELFHLWGIEADEKVAEELPFGDVGLNVTWTQDLVPYKTRKVRVLNGAHTMTVLAAYLYGKDTVKECMDDDTLIAYVKRGILEEVIPTLDLPKDMLVDYADAVFERFSNPFIKHYLLSISLNSMSKFKTRVLPSLLQYVERFGDVPKVLSFSMAAMLAFYQGDRIEGDALIGKRGKEEYRIVDDMDNLEMMKTLWMSYDGTRQAIEKLTADVLSRVDMWEEDLTQVPQLCAKVSEYLFAIKTDGIEAAIKCVL